MNEELFLHLAEIAGVFVGFGALISVRSAESRDPHARGYLRGIVWVGSATLVFALLPVVLAGYGLSDHALWLTCAIIALAVWVVLVVTFNRSPEMSGEWERAHPMYMRTFFSVGTPLHLIFAGGTLLIIGGWLPNLEPDIYATVVTATLVFATWTLVMLTWNPLPSKRSRGKAAATARLPLTTNSRTSAAAVRPRVRRRRVEPGRQGASARRVRAMRPPG